MIVMETLFGNENIRLWADVFVLKKQHFLFICALGTRPVVISFFTFL
jgi:hypothetical protein